MKKSKKYKKSVSSNNQRSPKTKACLKRCETNPKPQDKKTNLPPQRKIQKTRRNSQNITTIKRKRHLKRNCKKKIKNEQICQKD